MREARTITDYYLDIKRTPAMSGPWRRKKESAIVAILLGAAIGLTLAITVGYFLAGHV
jgi:hypothetical protein